jgi:hypothetical protein
MLSSSAPVLPARIRFAVLMLALCCALPGFAAEAPQKKEAAAADDSTSGGVEDPTTMAAFNVRADRWEEFGFRMHPYFDFIPGGTPTGVWVAEVFPNTAAAKAGLRPGDEITKVDGRRTMSHFFTLFKLQEKKLAELAAGKKSVTWSLGLRAPGAKETRTVTMVVPSPPPHWGSPIWRAPEGRTPAIVKEPGPLAERAREVMEHGIWTVIPWTGFVDAPPRYVAPVLAYEWRIVQPSGTHRIWVTQQRGKTEIVLDGHPRGSSGSLFLTSPSGALEKVRHWPGKKGEPEISPEETRIRFQAEIDFWLTQVRRGTGRWPFETLEGKTDDLASTSPSPSASADGGNATPRAATFLKLPVADAAERALFSDALGKIGSDEESWAYTETSRGFGDDRVTTVRVDPSKPAADRSTLLKVDGKAPKAAVLQRWRDEGRGAPSLLGELPPLASVVDVNDVRVFADETTAVVFELPVQAPGAAFPADKFQALFRVNKTLRAFEDFSVKLREAVRVAGVAKVTEAGLEVRLQTLDHALAPQPVFLKAGGGVRVLLVKFSRSFEATRTDFQRVVPFDEAAALAK